MKKIFCLIAAFMLLVGCDDGDMGYKTFDFTSVTLQACPDNAKPETTTEIYYKINGTEGLILTLPKGALINSPTQDPITEIDTPREIVLGSTNTLTYYDFVSKPTALCMVSEIPAYNEKWEGAGTLLVSTYPNLDSNNKLLGYTHFITIENVSFSREGETITVIDSNLGDVIKNFNFDFKFIATGQTKPSVEICTDSNILFTRLNKETLSLNVTDFAGTFVNTTGTKTIAIPNPTGEDDAIVLFNVYSSTASFQNVCAQGSNVPSLPVQKWQLAQGSIVIKTSETGGIYTHDIYLKDALFVSVINQQDRFYLDDVITVGTTDGYFFGTYQE